MDFSANLVSSWQLNHEAHSTSHEPWEVDLRFFLLCWVLWHSSRPSSSTHHFVFFLDAHNILDRVLCGPCLNPNPPLLIYIGSEVDGPCLRMIRGGDLKSGEEVRSRTIEPFFVRSLFCFWFFFIVFFLAWASSPLQPAGIDKLQAVVNWTLARQWMATSSKRHVSLAWKLLYLSES